MISPSTPVKEIIVISEYFSPSGAATAQLITDLVSYLATQFKITVLTATPSSAAQTYPYKLIRLCNSRNSSVNLIRKTLAGILFFLRASRWLLLHARSDSLLLIVSNPPFIGAIGFFLRILKSSRYVFLLQDVFPRSAILTGVLPAKGPITQFWTAFMTHVLSASSQVIVLNPLMKQRCIQDFDLSPSKVTSIENWAVEHASTLEKIYNPIARLRDTAGTFTVQYSGNFGRLHDMLTILEAARLLRDHKIKFHFIGNGAKRSQISSYIQAFQLDNVSLYPYQSRDNLSFSLGACDVSIISMIPGSEDTVSPSKLYGIIASGKPVLLVGSTKSHIAQLLIQHQCGTVVSTGDPSSLVTAILSLSNNPAMLRIYGENAKKLYNSKYGHIPSSSKYAKLLRSL